jgi:DNA-directed RNA polymerase subunit K/omega
VSLRILTSSLTLARQLWRYGEAPLASRARKLKPKDLIELGERAGEIQRSGEGDRLWPDGPSDKVLLLAATELLEGKVRPTQRTRRLPVGKLPPELQATEQELWDTASEVSMEELRLTLKRRKAGC